MATGCPCGATPKSEFGVVGYLTDELIGLAVNSDSKLRAFKGLLAAFTFSAIHVESLCLAPRAQMPEITAVDFVDVVRGWPKIAQALNSALYPRLCNCTACPPATNCGTGTSLELTPTSGWNPDPSEPTVYEYVIPFGTGIWAQRSDGYCLGHFSGVDIHWHNGPVFDPSLGVSVCDGDNHGCQSWSQNDLSGNVILYFDSVPAPSNDPWPDRPPGVSDWLGPPSCSTDDICTALEYVYQVTRRTEFLAQVAAGPLYGATTPYLFTLPGFTTPIAGTLAETLPRVISALGPISPSQLVDPEVVNVGESSVLELTGQAYVKVKMVAVPSSLGYKGSAETTLYYQTHGSIGPGYMVVVGTDGVLEHRQLVYGQGLELALPATASALAFQLAPNVEIDVTLYGRHV